MAIALQEMDDIHHIEGEIRRRPNGARVLRLLRELTCFDGRLASSVRHGGESALVAVALTAVVALLAIAFANLPSARSTSAPASALPAAGEIGTEELSLSAQQARAYMSWVRRAHARVAAQGSEAPMPETF